jgi:hypothetical protein
VVHCQLPCDGLQNLNGLICNASAQVEHSQSAKISVAFLCPARDHVFNPAKSIPVKPGPLPPYSPTGLSPHAPRVAKMLVELQLPWSFAYKPMNVSLSVGDCPKIHLHEWNKNYLLLAFCKMSHFLWNIIERSTSPVPYIHPEFSAESCMRNSTLWCIRNFPPKSTVSTKWFCSAAEGSLCVEFAELRSVQGHTRAF